MSANRGNTSNPASSVLVMFRRDILEYIKDFAFALDLLGVVWINASGFVTVIREMI